MHRCFVLGILFIMFSTEIMASQSLIDENNPLLTSHSKLIFGQYTLSDLAILTPKQFKKLMIEEISKTPQGKDLMTAIKRARKDSADKISFLSILKKMHHQFGKYEVELFKVMLSATSIKEHTSNTYYEAQDQYLRRIMPKLNLFSNILSTMKSGVMPTTSTASPPRITGTTTKKQLPRAISTTPQNQRNFNKTTTTTSKNKTNYKWSRPNKARSFSVNVQKGSINAEQNPLPAAGDF